MKTLKAGIVGLGKIGRAQLAAIRALGGAEVAAIAVRGGPDAAARGRALCDSYGIPKFYADYRDLVDDPDIDVVHCCAPNLEHFGMNRAAILAGKAVLSEKPLAADPRESAEIALLAKSRNVPTAVNFVYRHYGALQGLRAMVGAGALGQIYAVRGAYLQDWLLRESDWDWRVDPAVGGPSRAMADIGSHWCDLARFLAGQEVSEVCADLATFLPYRLKPASGGAAWVPGAAGSPETAGPPERVAVRTEDYGSALLRFSGGARGCFTVSQVSAGARTGLSIAIDGAAASALWEHAKPGKLAIRRRGEPEEVLDFGDELVADAQRSMIASFYERVRARAANPPAEGAGAAGGTDSAALDAARPYADFADGHAAVEIVQAIMESQKRRGWVVPGSR